jgi:hypothetical protein
LDFCPVFAVGGQEASIEQLQPSEAAHTRPSISRRDDILSLRDVAWEATTCFSSALASERTRLVGIAHHAQGVLAPGRLHADLSRGFTGEPDLGPMPNASDERSG